MRQVLAQPRIPTLQQRQQLMTNPVARVGQFAIRRVLTPALAHCVQISLNLGPRGRQHGPQDAPLGKLNHRMNGAQALRPRSAQKLREHRLSLVVERMRGGDGIDFTRRHQLPEPAIPQPPCRLFNRLARSFSRSVGIDLRFMEYQPQIRGQPSRKLQVSVRLSPAQPVMQMRCMKHQPKLTAPLGKRAQQGRRVRPARDANRQPQPGLEQRGVNWQRVQN